MAQFKKVISKGNYSLTITASHTDYGNVIVKSHGRSMTCSTQKDLDNYISELTVEHTKSVNVYYQRELILTKVLLDNGFEEIVE